MLLAMSFANRLRMKQQSGGASFAAPVFVYTAYTAELVRGAVRDMRCAF